MSHTTTITDIEKIIQRHFPTEKDLEVMINTLNVCMQSLKN